MLVYQRDEYKEKSIKMISSWVFFVDLDAPEGRGACDSLDCHHEGGRA